MCLGRSCRWVSLKNQYVKENFYLVTQSIRINKERKRVKVLLKKSMTALWNS